MPVNFISGLLDIVSVDMSRVGIKLARGVKSLLLDLLMLLILITVPHRHKSFSNQ